MYHQQKRPRVGQHGAYQAGAGARRLMQYLFHKKNRPHDNNIEFWTKLFCEYFAPSAKKRWCVSLHDNGRQTTGSVFPQDDVWNCEICNRKPGRGFETTFEGLPRLFQIKYASGTLEELLYVDMPREYWNSSGQIVLDYTKAIQERVFEQLRVVREGHLRIVFNQEDLKIASWEFCARSHEELIPRRAMVPQVSQLGAVVQKYQSSVLISSTSLSSQDLQNNCNSMDDIYNGLRVLEHIVGGSEKPSNLKLPLLKHITNNFSDGLKIGQGGCGVVYKGILPNGTVAVKKLFSSHTIDDEMFHREVKTMMVVQHQNVVRFLGYCSHSEEQVVEMAGIINMAQIRERLLCFEYLSNGSLENHITDELKGLEWQRRYQIIKGICEGLQHLHKEKHIIHMDLKPANILLDDHFVPKITDFGLSRLDEKSQTMSKERLISLGYCAPEYQYHGKMSAKSDIYSLGVIIIELLTGSKEKPNITKVLRRWCHRWNKSLKYTTPLWYQQVTRCLDLALRCKHTNPIERPYVWDIICELNQIDSIDVPACGQMIPFLEDMLGVEPLEIHLSFEVNKELSSSIELINNTDDYIAFRISTISLRQYHIHPNKDIVPPRSKCSATIALQPQERTPPHSYCRDEFSVQSTRVDASLTAMDITGDTFNEEPGKLVDNVDFMVVLDVPP